MAGVYTIDELKALLRPLLQKYRAEGASLFGSYARGEATPESDLDVIVHTGPAFDATDVFSIAEDLHVSSGKRVDVYADSEINPGTPFGQAVAKERLALL